MNNYHLSLILTIGSATLITAVAAFDGVPHQGKNSRQLNTDLEQVQENENIIREKQDFSPKNTVINQSLTQNKINQSSFFHKETREKILPNKVKDSDLNSENLVKKNNREFHNSYLDKEQKQEIVEISSKKDKKGYREKDLARIYNTSLNQAITLQKVSNKTKQNSSELNKPLPNSSEQLPLTLADVVALAVANNRDIKNAYLDRIAERAELAVAQATFLPKVTPRLAGEVSGNGTESIENTRSELDLGAGVSILMPTGTELEINWQTDLANSETSIFNDSSLGQELRVTLTQPLLRNGGVAVTTAGQKIAFINEEINVLNLKDTLIDTITNAILSYRALLQAQEQVNIQETALENAKRSVERVQALIDAGRLARVEIIENQAQVANFEVSLIQAQNDLESAKLDLINLLDIEQDLNIIAIETPKLDPFEVNPEQLQQFMFANNINYLRSKLRRETTKLNLLQAENNRLWNLDLNASYNNFSRSSEDFRAGLTLSRELNDRESESRFERSRVNLLQAENNLTELEESLKIQLTDSIRDLNLSYLQVESAIRARELAERNLEIEQTRREFGRTEFFRISELQTDLVDAQNAELNAIIAYSNARTRLEQLIGNTLNQWAIKIENE